MKSYITVVLVLCFGGRPASSIKCMECVDMPDPQDCTTTTECSTYETCHVTQFITTGGLVLYNSGCMAKNRCTSRKRDSLDVFRKRQNLVSTTDIVTCVSCCEREFCNLNGCGISGLRQPQRGPVCFACHSQADPKTCRDVETCADTQVCSLYQQFIGNQLVYTSKCDEKRRCQALSAIGRRGLQDSSSRCFKCCTGDFCNQDCGPSAHLTTPMPAPTTPKTTSRPSTTQKRTTAKPVTQKPTTAKPTTARPVTHKPTTAKPVTQKPTTAKPVTQKPTTVKPLVPTKATTVKPATHKPTTQKTTTHKSTTKPVTHKATTPRPTTHKATTAKPTPSTTKTTTTKRTTKATTPTTKPTTTPIPTTTKDPEIACKKDNYIFDSHLNLCLKFHSSQVLNWTQALQACESDNGTLAVITSPQKAKDVQNFISSHSHNNRVAYWVGANDKTQAHVFTWLNGETIVFQGNNTVDMKQANCLYIDGPTSADLKYESCTQRHAFICEKKNQIRTRSAPLQPLPL